MKRIVTFLMTTVLLITVVLSEASVCVEAKSAQISAKDTIQTTKERALQWLQNNQNANGSYGAERIVKDTCQVESLLRDMGIGGEQSWLITRREELSELATSDNDTLARVYCATGDERYLSAISKPNADGGLGLTAWYESDILDSMLVLEAYLRKNRTDGGYSDEINHILEFLGQHQKTGGGFAYLPDMEADDLLTARIGTLLLACEQYGSADIQRTAITPMLQGVEQFMKEHPHTLESQTDFEAAACQAIYLCMQERIKSTKDWEIQLQALQSSDGGFFDNLDCTIAAIRLMLAMEELNRPRIQVTGMETELSTYTACIDYDTEVEVSSALHYQTNFGFDGLWSVELWNNGVKVSEKETPFTFDEEKTESVLKTNFLLHPKASDNYQIRAFLCVNEEVLFDTTEDIRTTELSVGELELQAEAAGDDKVALNWNNLSNPYIRYGYRIFRSCEDGEWETRSSWNGDEKVKVLNVYPSSSYLNTWLTSKLAKEQVPAGKGLFEVSAVHILDYNRSPNTYLLDKNGAYKYDVVYFGACDSNGLKDISYDAYVATKAFADTGRGVLFGHDTVTIGYGTIHLNFARFAEQLGVKLKTDMGYVVSNKAKVVNSGVLTSYPWKLQGTLSIPQTHAYQQYTGGTTKATVWMELTNGGAYDKETGARANAYLFSRNQFAMIQTGHSNGQASDDERKVLANTLFYLKQLTADTSVTDPSAYDLAAPGRCEITDMTWTDTDLNVTVWAQDEGTKYSYYVQAQPQSSQQERFVRTSQVQKVCAASGIRGYAVCVKDTEEPCLEKEFGEILETEGDVLSLQIDGDEDEMRYLHIKAVDWAGNYGEEAVYEIPAKDNTDCLHTGYAMFADEGITVYGSSVELAGDVYAGADVWMLGSQITVDGSCDAVGSLHIYAAQVNMGEQNELCEGRSLPEFGESSLRQLPDVICTEGSYTYRGAQLDVTSICSLDGDITLSGSGLRGCGLIYAPNGTVTISVADVEYRGSIIAKRIVVQGSSLRISQMETEE